MAITTHVNLYSAVITINECEVEALIDECKKHDSIVNDGSYEFTAVLNGAVTTNEVHSINRYRAISLRDAETCIKKEIASAKSISWIKITKRYNWYDIEISMI